MQRMTRVPAGSLNFWAMQMSRKLVAAASVILGVVLFVVVLSFVGFESVIEPFREFSFFYLPYS